MMKQILTLNGGSSSIKFALFGFASLTRILEGEIERIGLPGTALRMKSGGHHESKQVEVSGHKAAADLLMENLDRDALVAIGHRVVHGGQRYQSPHWIDREMLEELQDLSQFDPEHLPAELALIEDFQLRLPDVRQLACFDTAFHRALPRVAQLLPIPRRYKAVRRYGFHGLSYQFLMEELARIGDPAAKGGRVILAHLGNGASLAAVLRGDPLDTSMSFTPASGIMMGTRSGDMDPGIASYLMQKEGLTPEGYARVVNHESGLLGVSETSSDMRDLLMREKSDERASDAIALFCYQVKKLIGSYAAALDGLDTLVFSGGMGENAPDIRQRICDGLSFLGISIDGMRNAGNDAVISNGRVVVRVMHTDEELMIAKSVSSMLAIQN